MGETEEFNTLAFEKRLMQLKDTQESIQGLSSWCLKQRPHHKKIVSSWLNVLKRVKVEQRLVLFYLANDVIQYSKRKNYEFVESWGLNLQKATPLVRDEKVRPKILRIFKIWEQRSVYDDEFLSDLTGLLSAGAIKKTDDDSEFQPTQLVNKIKQCSVLEADTDMRLKDIHDSHLELSDADLLRASLKGLYEERGNKDDVEKELNDGIACVERYTAALQREIVAREALLALLTSATQYYSTQRGEVKVVAYAYKNFGARVRALKRKLDELTPSLPNAAPSPPQRDEDVPSPGPDEDLELPVPTDGGDEDETNKIEVINSRPNDKQDFNINDVIKNLMSDNNTNASDNNSVTSAPMSQKSQDALPGLPGLDLLTPDTPSNPPPPTSFYGTMDLTDEPEPYHPEPTSPWSIYDQDYRVPPMVPPSDIVESVDMDLSEDEDQQRMYSNQQNQPERRHSFNNNKVLVGGDNGKVHNDHNHTNLIQIKSDKKESHSAPVLPPMVNPFDAMPPSLKNFNMNFQQPPTYPKTFDLTEENSNDSAYEEDLRNRGLDKPPNQDIRNPSPPFEDFANDDWVQPHPRFMNPRFPRNWGPRTNFRPQGFSPQQPWPRNGPRPPNRWMGPPRQRFW
ncbi:hypothetical protein B5X24_HaOG204053 [Helicoverpa armigera]|uniref:Regulation of nuclear pre-mRNA domain-containing protein 2 n=1 Tax=Helicoverpa armigera TaxID=29058 RepID=A0A2W1BRD2_HELAM|nr:hypothetical protein B5X24_HaOG204053 [Helicoverpa armigera]